jgi:hypothetical protein
MNGLLSRPDTPSYLFDRHEEFIHRKTISNFFPAPASADLAS